MVVDMNLILSMGIQLFQIVFIIAAAPLLTGWIEQNQAWLSNKTGAGIFQPYRNIHKLFLKETVLARNASYLFRVVPYLYFAAMCSITMIIPVFWSHLFFSAIADVIALIGLFALARIFLALAAMDIGTAFGSMGARREMLVSFLAEPAFLMVFFNLALMNQSTSLTQIVTTILSHSFFINPSLAFAAIAFFMVLLAENARIPIDNSATHLELTMIHEAMLLEYSGRHLALIKWGNHLKLLNYLAIAIALFCPWGITNTLQIATLTFAILIFVFKLLILGSALSLFEALTAKVRLFRASEFLTSAFILAILGVLIQLMVTR
jgi:formate hydrogenlyase subunit 4